MKKNIGSVDKTIRILVAALLAVLLFTKVITGVWAIVAFIAAMVFLFTTIAGVCPLYMALGMSSKSTKEAASSNS